MITDMILEYPEATATWRLWCQRSSQVRSSPQQRLLCWYSMMKATINAPTLAEQANASTHPSADQLQRRPFRSAHRGRPTTPTYQQSKRLGGYHRLTPMTQELPACSALSAQLVLLTVPHHPSARVSLQFLPVVAERADRLLEMRDGRITEKAREGLAGQRHTIRAVEPLPPEPGRSLSQPN